MQNTNDTRFLEQGFKEIDLTVYWKKLLKSWKLILLFAVAGGVLGVIIAFSTPKKFTSKAVMAPELTTRSTTGNLASLASLAGLSANTVGMTDAMHPDLYPVIIKSTDFLVKLFDMPVTFEHRDSVVNTNLYDYVLNYTRIPWYSYVLNAPMIAMRAAGNIVKPKKDDDIEEDTSCSGSVVTNPICLTKSQEMAAKMLSKAIEASVEKKTYVLVLKVTLQNNEIAANVANRAVELLQEFVISYRTQKARENVDYYQKLYDESREEYYAIERKYARYLDSHQGMVLKSVQVEQQNLKNEMELRYQLYNSNAQNLLNAQTKVSLESPVFVMVQSAKAPHRGSPSMSKLTLLFVLLGAFAGACVAIAKK